MPKVAITYSAAIGTVRRIFFPDDDRELDDPVHGPGPGESQVIAERAEFDRRGHQAIVNDVTGQAPVPGVDDRFAIVDPHGVVTHALIGDPACGLLVPEGHRAIRHAEAAPGWRFMQEAWVKPPEQG